MIGVLVLTAVLTLLFAVALRREFARLERERRLREFVATSPLLAKVAADLDAMKVTIGEALLPAMQDTATVLRRFGDEWWAQLAQVDARIERKDER